MTCNVKKHHRKRHPMSEGERAMWELRLDMVLIKRYNPLLAPLSRKALYLTLVLLNEKLLYLAKKRRKRDALRDAGRNPYKRGDKK